MNPRVYIETTIVSYLTARPSRDLVTAAHQQITHEWWQDRSPCYDLYVSPVVITEAGKGDAAAASRRLQLLQSLNVLALTDEAYALSQDLIARVPLPPRAEIDAAHIALAAVHGMHFLLTWNCAHIANATLRTVIETICRERGYEPPIICTPEELKEG
ncbi:MAG: type II toxin-antitoxin system VapC family toxin [Armatimonadetes bacterium]|nr:type II toxin-antitoxin system VapC family toxin [Armatimonadota bacterium]